MTCTAKILTHNGWWFRYAVHRQIGIGNPEKSRSLHRTLNSARRAARCWERREITPRQVPIDG